MIKGRNTTEACILREDCLSQDSYRKIKVTIGLSTKREQASNEEIDDFWILCREKKNDLYGLQSTAEGVECVRTTLYRDEKVTKICPGH